MAELGKSPEPLQIIGNRYRVACCLASGAETSVLGAVDCATGKRVALKCWDGPTSEQEVAAVQCFVRSANVSGLFENPHVVEVYGTELGDTISYSVTEWLEGSSLAREVARVGRLPLCDALKHVLPCMRAVVEAHAAGVIHGDIRPAHIFLCRATRHAPARARVFDFGRGAPGFHELRLPARVHVDEFCRYTPPELLCGAALDARSDVYGFGLLLYEIISGERIFVEDDLFDLLREIERGPKRAIADVTQTMPLGLTEVLYRAMALRPEDRYADLASFVAELEPFALERVVSHAPVTNVSTDQPKLSLRRARRVWQVIEEHLPQPRPVLSGAALIATMLGLGHLAFDNSEDASRSDSPTQRVTSQHASLHAEPVPPLPQHDLVIAEPLRVAEPARVPDERVHVSTRRSRTRRRAAQEAERTIVEPPVPSSNDSAAPPAEPATPLERMQLQ